MIISLASFFRRRRKVNETIDALLRGSYDVHLHATPCIQPRRKSIYQLAQEAAPVGMAGFVVKDHFASTAASASIVNEVQDSVKVAGGITICKAVGGFNVSAVETCFRMGGRVVWMPSLESQWMYRQISSPLFKSAANYRGLGAVNSSGGYSALADGSDNRLIEEVQEIIHLCFKYQCVFETSHFSREETFAALDEAGRQRVTRFVVTHANSEVTRYSIEDQKTLISRGATMMYTIEPYVGKPSMAAEEMEKLADMIRSVGSGNIVLATDFGLNTWPSAIEGIRMLIAGLLELGITPDELRMMLKDNPKRIYM